tara:strand:+ start:1492 stop:1716 length:225 start_codon:yes stop_codon:yes gene_type:complete
VISVEGQALPRDLLDISSNRGQCAGITPSRPIMTRAIALSLADRNRIRIRLLGLAALILIIIGHSLTGAPLAPA